MPIPNTVRISRPHIRSAIAALRPDLSDRTDTQIDAALAKINQDQIYDEEKSSWSVSVWDRVSPINGVPAEVFLGREDVSDGDDDIYLLSQNGQVVVFQPHEPFVGGMVRIPQGKGMERGASHANEVVNERARQEIIGRVLDLL